MPLHSQTRAGSGWRTAAKRVGPIAARALRPGARGHVRAVFERCFYVELDSGWVCVGGAGLGAGPLNLNWGWWAGPSRPAWPRNGEVAHSDGATLTAGPVAIALAEAEPWVADRVGAWDQASLARGLAAAHTALMRLAPRDGLALLGPADNRQRRAVSAAAQAPLAHLAQLLGGEARGQPIDAARLAPLIGLGPGLTPSGDDYLGGLMVALSLVGRRGLRDRLWQAIEPLTIERTTAISRVHLAAAAEGLGSAALHATLAAILSGASDRVAAACAGLAGVGHSSGWDGLAGALCLLRAAGPRAGS